MMLQVFDVSFAHPQEPLSLIIVRIADDAIDNGLLKPWRLYTNALDVCLLDPSDGAVTPRLD